MREEIAAGRWRFATRRWVISTFAVLVTLATIFFVGGGWFFSDEIESGGLTYDYTPSDFKLEIVSINGDEVVIRGVSKNERLGKPGVWGVESDSAFGRLYEIVSDDRDEVTRRLLTVEGKFNTGDNVRIDTYAFDGDPEIAHGIDFETVPLQGPLGELPAWFKPGEKATWVIFVHGRRASRQEALRLLPVAVAQDLPSLVITFRGDEGVEPDPSGHYRYGVSEWPDLEVAAQYAIDSGATGLVLVGYSMGGGVVMSFMENSDLADEVVGLVLDAPMLDFGLTIDHNAARKTLPL